MDQALREELAELARDMRENPRDWSGFELSDVLAKAGLTRERREDVPGWPYEVLYHPSWRELRLPIPSSEKVNLTYPARAADIIEEVLRRS